MRTAATAVLATIALLAAAGSARAATARIVITGDRYTLLYDVVYEAGLGETNVLSSEVSGNTIVLHDPGAAITPGDGCTAVAGGVSCAGGTVKPRLVAQLRDGDDVSTAAGDVDGGIGNDRLSGDGNLTGGPGEDVLAGDGAFIDGDGVTPSHDVYTGRGKASLIYEGRTTGIRVDLRGTTAAEDTFSGVANVTGGSGDDVLTGTAGPNVLIGNGGADRITALGGPDRIELGPDAPAAGVRADGGAGDDLIIDTSTSRGPHKMRCGSGVDELHESSLKSVVDADCERPCCYGVGTRLHARLASPAGAMLTIGDCECPDASFTLRARRKVVGRVQGRVGAVRVRLNAAGQRALRRAGRLSVTVEHREGGELTGFGTVLRLR